MDEGVGALVIIGIVIAVVVWVVSMALLALTWVFSALVGLLGHPVFVITAFTVAGAAGGLIYLRRKNGPAPAGSSDDFAEIGPFRYTSDGWATLVMTVLVGLLVLYGFLLI